MAWHRRCGCWLSPVSARRAGWAPAPWRAAWKGRQCCLQALETHVGTAVGLAMWLQGGQAALSGHRRAVAQEPLLVPRGSDHPQASVGAPVTWSWKRRRASSLRGRLWALGWGREGQQLLVGTGGESTPSGPGWWVRPGWEVHAASWAGLLLTEEMESQPRAPDAPRRSATCSGLGRTDLMGPEVCGNQGAPSAGAAGPCPCESQGKCCRRGLMGRRGSGRAGFGQ